MSSFGAGANTGLGDYVHLLQRNYQTYGIYRPLSGMTYNKNGNEAEAAAYQAYFELRSSIARGIAASGNAQDIAAFYTALMQQDYSKIEKYQKAYKVNEMEELLRDKIWENTQKEFNRLDLSMGNSMDTVVNLSYKYRTNNSTKKIQKRTLSNIWGATEGVIFELLLALQEGAAKGISVEQQIAIKKDIARLSDINAELKVLKESLDTEFSSMSLDNTKVLGNTLREIISEISSIAKLYRCASQRDIGYIGEVFGAVGAIMAGNIGNRVATDVLKKSLVGTNGSTTTYSNISTTFVDTAQLNNYMSQIKWQYKDGEWVNGRTSQDTVDVSVDYDDTNNIFNASQVNMSIKNYLNPLSTGAHVLSGAPLLSILNLVNTNFGNHYLNIIASHEDKETYMPKEVDRVIKYAIAVRALSGARTNIQENNTRLSQYFLVIDRTNRQVYAYTTASLLDKIYISPDTMMSVTGLPAAGTLTNTKDSNGPEGRITKLIIKIHQIKISASINPTALK